MGIRSTAKALIVRDGKLLLNRCYDVKNGEYYSMPGGGQNQYETIYDAVTRECLEETGYTVKPVKFAALFEEICLNEEYRNKYPDYAHKMYHIFICVLCENTKKNPTEIDSMQVESVWINIDTLTRFRILPKVVGDNIYEILSNPEPMFLGSEQVEFNHG